MVVDSTIEDDEVSEMVDEMNCYWIGTDSDYHFSSYIVEYYNFVMYYHACHDCFVYHHY